MTDLETKTEEYFEELKNKKILITISNINMCIKQAYKDGYEQGCFDYSHCAFFEQVCRENLKLGDEVEKMKLCGICKHQQERNCVKPYGTKTCEMWELAE